MRRHSRVGGETVKTRRHKAARLKRGNAPKAVRGRSASVAGRETEITRLTRELNEALEQQTATSDVLEVISRSAFDLNAVFDTVAESSVKLCGADRAFIFRFDGELLRMAATFNVSRELKEFVERNPIRPGRHSTAARAALERRTIHIPDVLADPEFSYGAKNIEAIRTNLAVPILRGDDLLGVILIYRLEVRPFTDNQIALVETFAKQAVIAIENTRLLNELRQRTTDLTEALDQQTATADVLRVISASPGELQPVFQSMLENATRICEAKFGTLYLRDADAYRAVAIHNAPPAYECRGTQARSGATTAGFGSWPDRQNAQGGSRRRYYGGEVLH
jgi:two-component system, NtrC family, sensor kinase